MKILKPHHLCLSLALLGCSFPSYAQLMLSQYIDGTANRKGLEIYNPDGSAVNLSDYEIQQFSNGSTSKSFSVTLQGSLSSKAKFVIGRSELQAEIGNKVNQVAGLSFNGDDTLVLLYKGTPIDRFGRVGEKPANNGWGTAITSYQNSLSRSKLLTNSAQNKQFKANQPKAISLRLNNQIKKLVVPKTSVMSKLIK